MSGAIAFALFYSVQRLILSAQDPFASAKRYVPIYMYLVGFIVAMVTFTKGLKHVGLHLSFAESLFYAMLVGALVTFVGILLERRVKRQDPQTPDCPLSNVERVFGILMMFTACAMAFAHGSNDVANAVGPLAAVVGVVNSGGLVAGKTGIPAWILLLGALGIVAGLVMYGHKVIATIGNNITELTPSRGFAATLAAAITVVIASGTGLPISTTHTLVGAVLGVGLARGVSALNLRMVNTIFISWIVTLPAGATLAIIFFFILQAIFS